MIRLTLTLRGEWMLATGDDAHVIAMADPLWHICATLYAVRTCPSDADRRADALFTAYDARKDARASYLFDAGRRVLTTSKRSASCREFIAGIAAEIITRQLFERRIARIESAARLAIRYAEARADYVTQSRPAKARVLAFFRRAA